MKVLITGARGFVGQYVAAAIEKETEGKAEIFLSSIARGVRDSSNERILSLDVTDFQSVLNQLERIRPTHVLHLAGLAAVQVAAANSAVAWRINLFGTLNVAQAILQTVPDCVFLHVGSGQVYGSTANQDGLLTEASLLAPTNPYEASKAAADLAVGAMAGSGLRSIRLRPFNHTGPGQSEHFVVPSFAMQIARIKAGRQEPVIRVGNLSAQRDFLDVRDVARAYALTITRSSSLPNNTVLNIASGVGVSIQAVLDRMVRMSGIDVQICTDPLRIRHVDIPRFVGDASLARRLLSWAPKITFDQTLLEILNSAEA